MFDSFFGYLIGGAVIGILARFIKPGADPMGWILTILLGVVGAWLGGGIIATALGLTNSLLIWAVAIVTAIVLLFLYEAIRSKSAKK